MYGFQSIKNLNMSILEKLVCFDTDRFERIGLTEAILANVKTPEQISDLLNPEHYIGLSTYFAEVYAKKGREVASKL